MSSSLGALGFVVGTTLALLQAQVAFASKLPTPQLETLPNGMKVAWFVSDAIPVIDLALLVESGHRDDPAGRSGTAELVSSALDRGAAGMTAQQIARAIEMLGASRYISADEDTFSIGMHGLAPDAETLLELLGKIATRPEFPEAEVAREKERLLDRWNHIGEYGEALAGIAFQRMLSAGTSYGRGAFAAATEFKKVTREDVLAYHRTHFTPGNAILAVIGRVKPEEFRKRIVEVFSAWKGGAPARSYRTFRDPRVAAAKNQILVVDRPDLTQAQVRIGFPAPLITSPAHYELVVANALLGEYFNSRLNAVLRDKLGLTYGAGSSFSYSKEFASFAVSSATQNSSVGQLTAKALEILKELKKEPIPANEITMAKEYLVGGFPLRTSTLGAVASRWLAGYVYGLGPDYLNEFIPRVQAVTPQGVHDAVAKHFVVERAMIVIAGDAKAIRASLKAAGFGSIRQVSVRDLL